MIAVCPFSFPLSPGRTNGFAPVTFVRKNDPEIEGDCTDIRIEGDYMGTSLYVNGKLVTSISYIYLNKSIMLIESKIL